jgi:hypothetical protein
MELWVLVADGEMGRRDGLRWVGLGEIFFLWVDGWDGSKGVYSYLNSL